MRWSCVFCFLATLSDVTIWRVWEVPLRTLAPTNKECYDVIKFLHNACGAQTLAISGSYRHSEPLTPAVQNGSNANGILDQSHWIRDQTKKTGEVAQSRTKNVLHAATAEFDQICMRDGRKVGCSRIRIYFKANSVKIRAFYTRCAVVDYMTVKWLIKFKISTIFPHV